MDFITKLLKSENIVLKINYDSILMIVNKFTKHTHLISYNERSTAKQTA